jgi:hypothetical protein
MPALPSGEPLARNNEASRSGDSEMASITVPPKGVDGFAELERNGHT